MNAAVLRGAVVGYGNVAASGHMPYWRSRPDVRIVAAVDPDPVRRALFEAEGSGRAYPTLDALLAAERLDFVDICSAPNVHAAQVDEALDAGLDVLCEKPLTIAVADTLRIAAGAAATDCVVHTVHNWLEAPVCREVSALIAAGAVGTVRSVAWATLRTAPAVTVAQANWRLDPRIAGGGILIDHGWHALYCVAAWAGAAPRTVAATLERRRHLDLAVEDTATLRIGFDDGVEGSVHLSWAADARGNSVAVTGSEGTIEVTGATIALTQAGRTRRWECPPSLAEGSHHPDWFARAADGFLDAMRGRATANIAEAVRCSLMIDAAQRSSLAGGRPMALAEPVDAR